MKIYKPNPLRLSAGDMPNHISSLMSVIQHSVDIANLHLTDMEICCFYDNGEICPVPVHSAIMCSLSPLLLRLFRDLPEDDRVKFSVHIPESNPNTLMTLRDLVYSGSCRSQNERELEEVVRIASLLNMEHLCSSLIIDSHYIENEKFHEDNNYNCRENVVEYETYDLDVQNDDINPLLAPSPSPNSRNLHEEVGNGLMLPHIENEIKGDEIISVNQNDTNELPPVKLLVDSNENVSDLGENVDTLPVNEIPEESQFKEKKDVNISNGTGGEMQMTLLLSPKKVLKRVSEDNSLIIENENGFCVCPICGKVLKSKVLKKRNLYDHMAMRHYKNELERDFLHDGKCTICFKDVSSFRQKKDEMIRHLGSTHNLVEIYANNHVVQTQSHQVRNNLVNEESVDVIQDNDEASSYNNQHDVETFLNYNQATNENPNFEANEENAVVKKCQLCQGKIVDWSSGSCSSDSTAYNYHLSLRHFREALLEDYGSETWTCPICDISFFDASSPEIKFVTHLGVAHDLVKKYLKDKNSVIEGLIPSSLDDIDEEVNKKIIESNNNDLKIPRKQKQSDSKANDNEPIKKKIKCELATENIVDVSSIQKSRGRKVACLVCSTKVSSIPVLYGHMYHVHFKHDVNQAIKIILDGSGGQCPQCSRSPWKQTWTGEVTPGVISHFTKKHKMTDGLIFNNGQPSEANVNFLVQKLTS